MRDMNEPISQNPSTRTKFKQRIAGGAVLLIVLVIFLPFIFHHAHNANVNLDSVDNSTPNAETPSAVNPAAPPAPASTSAAHTETSAPAAQEAVAPPSTPTAVSTPSSDQSGLTSAQNESPSPAAQSDAQVVLPPPQVGTVTAASPPSNEVTTPANPTSPAETPKTDTVAVAQKSPNASVTKSTPAPAAGRWILQVGSFNNAKNAQKLTAQLRSRGFHAYMQRGANQSVRVYVGPLSSLQQAQKVQERVQGEFKVSALVREVRD